MQPRTLTQVGRTVAYSLLFLQLGLMATYHKDVSMRRSFLLVAFASIALTACTRELSLRGLSEAQQEVQGRFDAWVLAMNNMDLTIMVQMSNAVPELTVISADGQVAHGSEEAEALHQRSFEGVDRINFGVQNVEIQILTRRIALVTFRHSTDIILTNGERAAPNAGYVSMVWLKDRADNQWKVHMEHHSINPPGQN